MRLLVTFAALFVSLVLLQLGAGGIAPLDAVAGLARGFSAAEVGLLGSAHFAGFFIGCWWAPRVLGAVGHSRAFAAFVAVGTIGILAHTLIVSPTAWALMRVMSGFCVAGAFTVVEAWLQAKVTNATRGRAMGIYRAVDIGGSLLAQLLIAVLPPESYISYNLLALFCCAALIPLALTRTEQPPIPAAPRLRPALAWRRSPLAAAGVVVSGLTSAAFRMVGPVYGVAVGLTPDLIAIFLAAFVAGGALAQYPAGWIADKVDRRVVLIGLSVAAIGACAATVALATGGAGAVMLGAALFGLTTFPIYSVSAAHAFDFARADEQVELAASLMFLYAVGAILSPVVVSALIGAYGPAAMFVFVAVAHVGLIIFGLYRMRIRPAETRTAYVYAPRTSFLIGRLLRRPRAARPARNAEPSPGE